MKKTILFNLTDEELEKFVTDMGQPRFRAKQITEWLDRGAPDFSAMKNLPENLRKDLDKIAVTMPAKIIQKLESSDNQTVKFLLEMEDGQQIESVLMKTTYGNSVCVSSQAGCAMGCKFCASTLLGLNRNLSSNEMYAQVLVCAWELQDKRMDKNTYDKNNGEVTHVVIMGTGEPLQNTPASIQFMERLNTDLSIGWRRITISTCGIVPGIQELIEWGKPVNLAISLHAANDETRGQIMPINNKYNLDAVLNAAFEFSDKNNRQLMIEYIALGHPGKDNEVELYNCTPDDALQLSALLKGRNCMVNIIPWNDVQERDFAAPSNNAIHRFQDILIENGIHTRIRRERGQDIGSACGQLRLNSAKK